MSKGDIIGKKKSSVSRRILKWILLILLSLMALSIIQVLSLRFVNPPLTVSMLWERLKSGGSLSGSGLTESWRSLEEISPNLRRAVLAGEDQRFLSHWGFDFIEINKALKDLALERGVRGASTITMQTARTVFLWHGRSLSRKVLEAYYTVFMELLWGKERILEVYLNTVDWGDGITGAESASREYFDTSCSRLSREQAALLAAILPSPHRWSPLSPGTVVLRRKERILKDMPKVPLLG